MKILPEPHYSGRGVVLYRADYAEILPQLAPDSIDALITDPPYAITNLAWDQPVDWTTFWPQAHRLCRPHAPLVFFASGKFVPTLISTNWKHYRYDLVWEKNLPVGHLDANRRPLRSHESILVFAKQFRGSTYNPQKVCGRLHSIGKGSKPAHYGNSSGNVTETKTNLWHPRSVLHPTQKPLDLMRWLIRTYTNRNDLILEPFAGSGSTLAAAAALGRSAIGIERDPAYCDIIAKRLEDGAY